MAYPPQEATHNYNKYSLKPGDSPEQWLVHSSMKSHHYKEIVKHFQTLQA